jgi:gluconate kinase
MSGEKKTYMCPAGCGWSKIASGEGDLIKHLAMSGDALHSGWRIKHDLPAQPILLGEKGRKEYLRRVRIALFSVLYAKKK